VSHAVELSGGSGAGQEIKTRPFRLVTGGVQRYRIRRARGRTDVPRIVDRYMDGKINIDDLITQGRPERAELRRARRRDVGDLRWPDDLPLRVAALQHRHLCLPERADPLPGHRVAETEGV
jgi:hypothetical protein